MLDMKLLRNQFDDVKEKLQHRGEELSELEKFGELDEKRRNLNTEVEQLKAKRNEASKRIAQLKRENKDVEPVIKEMREVGEIISTLDEQLKNIEEDSNNV